MHESFVAQIFTPQYFGFLLLGVSFGIVLGVIPGVGGVAGLALMLPFVFKLSAANAIPLLIGMIGTTVTADTITCVLLGTPGTAGSQATIIDGFPMAKKGEAGKAKALSTP